MITNKFKCIYNKLENLPELSSTITLVEKEEINKLIDYKSNSGPNFYSTFELMGARNYYNKLKSYCLYLKNDNYSNLHSDIQSLVIKLINKDLVNFEDWIQKSDKISVKIILLSVLLNKFNYIKINIKNLEKTKIPILQVFYIKRKYKPVNEGQQVILNTGHNINNLLDTNMPNNVKLVAYLSYINDMISFDRSIIEILNNKKICKMIDKLSLILIEDKSIKINEFFLDNNSSFKHFKYALNGQIIYFLILKKLNKLKKIEESLPKQFINHIISEYLILDRKNFNKNNHKLRELNFMYSNHYFSQAELLGYVLLEFNNFAKIKNIFDKEINILTLPYNKIRNKNYYSDIIFFLFLLIAFLNYCEQANKNDLKKYSRIILDILNEVKNDNIICCNNLYIVLIQIIKFIEKNTNKLL